MFAAIFRTRYRWFPILLTLALFLTCQFTLTSCNPAKFKNEAGQVSQWIASTISNPKTFNYALNNDYPYVFLFTTEGLTTLNGVTGKIEPALAKSWEISDDKKRITFTLREKLKWSDGKPLTVDDVIFTYQDIIFNPQIPTDWKDRFRIGSTGILPQVRKIDNSRIEFILPEPFAPFLYTTTGSSNGLISILPKHALEASIKTKDAKGYPRFLSTWGTDTKPSEIIVNGPYKIESYTPNQRVVFRRNPYYWRRDSQGNQLPYIERVILQITESTDTSVLQFRSGSLDTIQVSPENFSLLKKEEKRGKFTIYNGGSDFSTTFIFFNLNKGHRQNGQPVVNPIKSRWFNTLAFRQAVAHAIDRQAMLNNVYRGIGVLQNSPIDIQSPYYLSPENGLKVYDYNPVKAKELLLEAGFKYNDRNQLLDAEGYRVRFTLIASAENKIRVAMAAQIKQDLSKIGIQVDFNPIALSSLADKLANTLDWESCLVAFEGGIEPNDRANLWLPEGGSHLFNQKPQLGQEPLIDWKVAPWEAEIGRLYVRAAQELDQVKRQEIYAETQQLTQEYLPLIYLVNPLLLGAVRDRIQNVKFSALGFQQGTLWNKYELITDQN